MSNGCSATLQGYGDGPERSAHRLELSVVFHVACSKLGIKDGWVQLWSILDLRGYGDGLEKSTHRLALLVIFPQSLKATVKDGWVQPWSVWDLGGINLISLAQVSYVESRYVNNLFDPTTTNKLLAYRVRFVKWIDFSNTFYYVSGFHWFWSNLIVIYF